MAASDILRTLEKIISVLFVVGGFGLFAYMFMNGFGGDADFDGIFDAFKLYFIVFFVGIFLIIVISIVRRRLESKEMNDTPVYTAPGPMDYERRYGNNHCRSCGSNLGSSDPTYCPECGSRRK